MKAFKRIFKYVWPQWHRLVVIVVSAMIIGLLFAFSIGTILPLLKVMMGEEGLHGWVDRLISKDRYGVNFYVPDKIDMSDPNVVYHLRVTSVKEKSQAAVAGLEHCAGLSGGQLQRIAIARAILKNPTILIFDEATSHVDADSEAKIHKAIEEIMRDRTSFIIAHRFSTVTIADVIVVMNDGRIISQGQHDELIQTCTLYQSLYKTQLVRA